MEKIKEFRSNINGRKKQNKTKELVTQIVGKINKTVKSLAKQIKTD